MVALHLSLLVMATPRDDIEVLIKEKCKAAGGFGTTTGMIPWAYKLGDKYIFNVGPEETCKAGIDGSELWVSDLTDAGTRRIHAAPPAVSAEQPSVLADKALLIYVASAEATGDEVWVSDGTTEGTKMLLDIHTGPKTSGASMLLSCGDGNVYFGADDGTNGRELWATDGTAAGTRMVHDVTAGANGSVLGIGECQAGKVLFTVGAGDTVERWTTAGTSESTKPAPMKAEL